MDVMFAFILRFGKTLVSYRVIIDMNPSALDILHPCVPSLQIRQNHISDLGTFVGTGKTGDMKIHGPAENVR
jgi:hypothetical protein